MRRYGAALPLALLLALAGCGGHTGPTAPPAASASASAVRPGAADVPFLAAMAAHHERTLAITRAAAGRVTDGELRNLVAAVEATETDELATIRRWLSAPPPGGPSAQPGGPSAQPGGPSAHSAHPAQAGGHSGHPAQPGDHGRVGAHGDAADEGHRAHADPDLTRLRSAAPGRFDAVLIEVLTAHQRTAAALAHGHLPVAVSPEVRDLADRIDRSRTAQIALMSRLPAAGATPSGR
ncbi:DUF305 domain-containing protein [Micromonospora sp. B11E3]|uniref:DUF305 domain-containing protein n=1 Tax=Micromonospora sp. B11E3 TaxID=3153562 RepID=UPI00325CC2A5